MNFENCFPKYWNQNPEPRVIFSEALPKKKKWCEKKFRESNRIQEKIQIEIFKCLFPCVGKRIWIKKSTLSKFLEEKIRGCEGFSENPSGTPRNRHFPFLSIFRAFVSFKEDSSPVATRFRIQTFLLSKDKSSGHLLRKKIF